MVSTHTVQRCCCLILFSVFTLYGTPAAGQYFDNCLSTTSNATVLIPGDVSVTLEGDSLATGDEVALFTNDGACAGAGQWTGSNLAIAVAGINSQESEGYEPDEPFKFKIWDSSATRLYSVNATYEPCAPDEPLCQDDGLYETDAVFEIERLTTSTQPDTADLSLDVTVDSARIAVGQETTFSFILHNDGPDAASDLEVTTSAPSNLALISTSTSRGTFETSDSTWTLGSLSPNASDTLTVTTSSTQPGTFTFSAEVSASALSDPDSSPNNGAVNEDDQRNITITVVRTVECQASSIEWQQIDRPASEPSAIVVTVTNPDGLVGVNFVDEEGQPALQNLTATTSNAAFTSSDGIHWRKENGANAPTGVQFTLTQADPGTMQAQYEAEALSVCPAPDPRVTRFDPSPAFIFETGPLSVTLSGNAPNPFRNQTSIHFALTAAANVTLVVYDVLGRKVATLVDEEMTAGSHTVPWNGRTDSGQAVSSGVYLYRLQADDHVKTARMNVIR